jgi:hypothetical protein
VVRVSGGTGNFSLHHRVQPPIQWVTGALPLGRKLKRPDREANHSLPSSSEVKNAWNYNFTPQYAAVAWYSVKKKHRDDFTFYLFI